MKKIKRIGELIALFTFCFYNTCFADLVFTDSEIGKLFGGGTVKPTVPETKPVNYILIGVLVLVVVACAVIIIRKIIIKKKEKENDINK